MGDMNDVCKHDDFEAYCPLCREELKQQRDDLLVAIEKALDIIKRDYDSTDAIAILDAAISNTKVPK